MTNDPRPIGILGGTFHPIHKGHIMMAHIAMAQLDLKQVWFLPDGMPPHKSISCVTPQQRLEMVRLAVEDEKGFVVTEREVAREGYTYTVDTMRELTRTRFWSLKTGRILTKLPKCAVFSSFRARGRTAKMRGAMRKRWQSAAARRSRFRAVQASTFPRRAFGQ